MNFRVVCKQCDAPIRVTDKHFGRRIKCPRCEAVVNVPQSTKSASENEDSDGESEGIGNYPPVSRKQYGSNKSRSKRAVQNSKQSLWIGIAVGVGVSIAAAVLITVGLMSRTGAAGRPADVATTESPESRSTKDIQTAGAAAQTGAAENTPPTSDATVAAVTNSNSPSKVAPPLGNSSATAGLAANKNPVPETSIEKSKPLSTDLKNVGRESATGNNLSSLIDRVGRGVVLIRISDANGQNLGLGSGFVINRQGLIATNYHVLKKATTAEAEFRDGTRYPISGYRAYDEKRDIAIVQLETTPPDIEPLELGTSSDIRQGSSVIAMGHPRGLRFTATEGIVSAIHATSELPSDLRSQLKSPDDQIWIQTNATIFSGNSGGPLLLQSGKVVGIISWITRDINFGFALAIQHLTDLMSQLKESPISLAEVNRAGAIQVPKLGFGKVDPLVQTIIDEFRRHHEEFAVLLGAARTLQEQTRILTAKNPARRHAPRLIKVASDNPKTPVSYQALFFALSMLAQYYPESTAATPMQQVTAQLLRDHIEEKTLGHVVMLLSDCKLPCAQQFLKDLLQRSSDRDVQGVVCLVLGRTMSQSEAQNVRKESIKLLERVVNEFSDVLFNDAPIVESAKPLLFGLQHLSVGSEAPEIVGHDADGNELKLSSFRGKVVMLDFFADWCPHCTRMYPLERIMVEKTKNMPCVLLGVNCDDREVLRQIIKEKKITWKCWSDGEAGPIATEWQLSGYPLIYIIDQEGIIRHRFEGSPDPDQIDKALTNLVRAGMKKR